MLILVATEALSSLFCGMRVIARTKSARPGNKCRRRGRSELADNSHVAGSALRLGGRTPTADRPIPCRVECDKSLPRRRLINLQTHQPSTPTSTDRCNWQFRKSLAKAPRWRRPIVTNEGRVLVLTLRARGRRKPSTCLNLPSSVRRTDSPCSADSNSRWSSRLRRRFVCQLSLALSRLELLGEPTLMRPSSRRRRRAGCCCCTFTRERVCRANCWIKMS